VPPFPEPDSHQAGLNSMQPTTGYVESIRLKSPSYEKQMTKEPSRGSQSSSQYRDKSPSFSSKNRQSRAPYRSSYRSNDRSSSTRRLYPQMQRGLNCRLHYDPHRMKHCTKCMKNDHHEFECSRYYKHSDQKCAICHRMYHNYQECREGKEFPPRIASKN
jgi:hypothetical protein